MKRFGTAGLVVLFFLIGGFVSSAIGADVELAKKSTLESIRKIVR